MQRLCAAWIHFFILSFGGQDRFVIRQHVRREKGSLARRGDAEWSGGRGCNARDAVERGPTGLTGAKKMLARFSVVWRRLVRVGAVACGAWWDGWMEVPSG